MRTTQHNPSTGDVDPFFTFDYVQIDQPETASSDQRATTYWDVERGARGPDPRPEWVVVDAGAVDTELGVLKTGKEADVFLLDRRADLTGEACLMAAKRYRDASHSSFHRSTVYTEGRGVRRSRDERALSRGSTYGRQVAAGMWARAEWNALCVAWSAGVAVPYPVSVQGTELLLEFVGSPDGEAAPRLAQTRPDPDLLEHCWHQVREIVLGFAGLGWAHGDLSPYNLLLNGEVLVAIDVPQVVDLAANPHATTLLHRDCTVAAGWFGSRGYAADGEALFAEALVQVT